MEIATWESDIELDSIPDGQAEEEGLQLKKSAESEDSTSILADESADMESTDSGRTDHRNIIRPILNP